MREEIIKAVPEIMELKFGCRFDDGEGKIETYITDLQDGSYMLLDADQRPFRYHGTLVKRFNVGRPIRLADILFTFLPKFTNHDYDQEKDRDIISFWNLQKDDLSLQCEGNIDFLHSLLIK